jgi:hypothetical protein
MALPRLRNLDRRQRRPATAETHPPQQSILENQRVIGGAAVCSAISTTSRREIA